MKTLLFYGLACALLPIAVALLQPALRVITRPLVILLCSIQVLIVPVAVAADPNISFGSDAYSLAAGVSIVLISIVEAVFVLGTAVGLLGAIWHIGNCERRLALRRWEDGLSVLPPLNISTPALDLRLPHE